MPPLFEITEQGAIVIILLVVVYLVTKAIGMERRPGLDIRTGERRGDWRTLATLLRKEGIDLPRL
jgi:hypothetical protein